MLMMRLRDDSLAARKARDEVKSNLMIALVGEAAMVGKNNGNRETTDEEVLKVIKKFLDNAKETFALVRAQDNIHALAKSKVIAREVEILEAYLPEQMSEETLRLAVATYRNLTPDANVGMIMKHLQSQFGGRYDGKLASQIAKEDYGFKLVSKKGSITDDVEL